MIYIKNKKGFSIIEVLAAVFIISLGLVSVLTLAEKNIQNQYINRNNIIASMLAQEGLELVRAKRDSNWLAGANWKSGISGIFRADYNDSSFSAVAAGDNSNTLLKINGNGYYDHGGVTATDFYRWIEVTDSTDDYIELSCTVRFKKNNINYDYVASTVLYGWGY